MIPESVIDAVFDAVLVKRSRCTVQSILDSVTRPAIGVPVEMIRARAGVLSAMEPEAALALREIADQCERKLR